MKTSVENFNIIKYTPPFLLGVSLERELHLSRKFLEVLPLLKFIEKSLSEKGF